MEKKTAPASDLKQDFVQIIIGGSVLKLEIGRFHVGKILLLMWIQRT
jgi:hypothetical protein